MRSFTFVSLVMLVLATLSTAWSHNAVDDDYSRLVGKRADSSTTDTAQTTTADTTTAATTQTGSSASETGSSSTDSTSGSETGTNTAKKTGQTTNTKGTATKTTNSATSTFIDPRLAPGGISLMTPATTSTTYFKVGNYVTFAWNYTSLSVTPSGIDVIASCSLNSATYTLANNMSVSPTGAVTWDTNNYQASATVPLLTASYTLIIYEAGTQPSDVASAGHLEAGQYVFGMYLPQSYTPLNEYVCATCNAALSDMERQALGFLFTMATITVLSFTWFAGGFGVFS